MWTLKKGSFLSHYVILTMDSKAQDFHYSVWDSENNIYIKGMDFETVNQLLFSCRLVELYVHWASKETYHFFRVTFTEIHPIKIIHIWKTHEVNLSLISTSKKTKVYFNQRGDKHDEIARGQFSKITETARLSGWEFKADKSRSGVYVTRYWN